MNFAKLLGAGLIASTVAGSAFASTVGSTGAAGTGPVAATYGNGLTIAAEAIAAGNYTLDLDGAAASPLGNAVGADIRFVPSFGLNTGDIITLTFTNALYMGADVKLVAEEAAAQQAVGATDVDNDGDTLDVVEVATNFGTLDAVNGVSSVQMRINNGLILPTGIELRLQVTGANLCQACAGTLANTTDNPTVLIPQGSTGSIRVASSGVTSGGVAIGAANNTNDGIFADILTQFSLTPTSATSVIDVAAATPRTAFVDETAGGAVETNAGDTDLTGSAGTLAFANNNVATNAIEDFILLDAGDLFALTLTSSTNLDGVDTTTAGANFFSTDNNGAANATNTALALVTGSTTTLTGTVPGAGAGGLPASGATLTDDLVLTTDGTTVLLDRTFSASGTLTMDADVAQVAGAVISFTGGTTHTWTTNGTVLEATYVNTNGSFNNRFMLSNSGGNDAPYTITCIVEAGNTCTPGASGVLPAGESVVINGADAVTMGGTGNQNRATVIFTVDGPTTTIQGHTAIVKPGTGIESSHPMIRPGTN